MFKFITSKPLWVNILAGILIVFLIVFLFFESLDWITDHNNYANVPNVIGQNVDAAKDLLKSKGFSVQVIDSVYDNSVGPLSVVRQSPDAESEVKNGRTIYLTINRAVIPSVNLPNMVGFSLRSAEMYLSTLGLRVGTVTYKPDIAKDAIIEQLYNGQPVASGTPIPMGSMINFVVGSGVSTEAQSVPDLIGLTVAQAKARLAKMGLSLGAIVPMDAVDPAQGYIVKQTPEPYSTSMTGQQTRNRLKAGQAIDVYISSQPPVKDTASTGSSEQGQPN